MATIKVNSTVMRSKATTLKAIAKSIKQFTEDMTAEMNRMKNTWEGDVAETTVKNFQNLSGAFQERFDVINSYADFLDKASEEWDRVNAEHLQGAQGK